MTAGQTGTTLKQRKKKNNMNFDKALNAIILIVGLVTVVYPTAVFLSMAPQAHNGALVLAKAG